MKRPDPIGHALRAALKRYRKKQPKKGASPDAVLIGRIRHG